MGYYTNYNLTVTKIDKVFEEKVDISAEQQLIISKKLIEISDWFEADDLENVLKWDNDNPLYGLIYYDEMKWYDHYKDMIELSKIFPELYFELEGRGEERDDIWCEYFHNGEGSHSEARIVFDEPQFWK